MSLIKSLTEVLLERDFKIIPKMCSSTAIGEDTAYLTLIRFSGTAVYVTALINSEDRAIYEGSYTLVKSYFDELVEKYNCSKGYFIGLFIGNEESLRDFCTNDIEDYTALTAEIRWIVDPTAKRLVVLGEQPNKISDLSEIINIALKKETGAYSVDTDIKTLVEKERDNRLKTVKSFNSYLTLSLIFINIIIHILLYFSGQKAEIIGLCSIGREAAFNNNEIYRLITSVFLHADILHIGSNMLFLYVFGSSVERYYGKLRYILIYLISGLGGNLIFCLTSSGTAIGASGAVFGLIGAVLAYSLITKRAVDGKDLSFMAMFIIISLGFGFLDATVANLAHIGGIVFGFIFGLAFYPKKT